MLDFTSSSGVEELRVAPPAPDAGILDAYSNAVISVADAVGPAVVRVETRGANGRPGGVGSGVVIAPDGLVLTNSHVVDGAKEVRLLDGEGRVMEARRLGEDPDTDLALLRASSARDLAHAALAGVARLRPRFNPDHGGTDAVGDADHGVGIGVEQGLIVGNRWPGRLSGGALIDCMIGIIQHGEIPLKISDGAHPPPPQVLEKRRLAMQSAAPVPDRPPLSWGGGGLIANIVHPASGR